MAEAPVDVRYDLAVLRQTAKARHRFRRRANIGMVIALPVTCAVVGIISGFGWWTILPVLIVTVAARPLYRVLRRPWIGRRSGWLWPFRGGRRRRAERFLAHAYAASALREYDLLLAGRGSGNARLLLDAAYAAYAAEQYQRCLDLARLGSAAARPRSRRLRGELAAMVGLAAMSLRQDGTARTAVAEATNLLGLAQLKGKPTRMLPRVTRFLPVAQMLIRAAAARNMYLSATSIGLLTARHTAQRMRTLTSVRLLTETGDVLLHAGRAADAAACFDRALHMVNERYFDYDDDANLPEHGVWRPLIDVMSRAVVGEMEADLATGVEGNRSISETVEYLERLERPLELARLHRLGARMAQRAGKDDEALKHLLQALDRIDRSRYEVRDPVTRRIWLRANLEAHRSALNVAHRLGRHETVCELVETARLQALPADNEGVGTGSGDVEIALKTPPRITIGGRSDLIGATGIPPGTEALDLRDLLTRTRGTAGVLLSYWSNEDGHYWSVLTATTVHSGRFDADDSAAKEVLADLPRTLSNSLPGEDGASRAARVRKSPYYSGREAERELARRLRDLLPPPLLAHLRSADRPVALTILPSPPLASVPWPLVAVDDEGTQTGDPSRLIERADLRLGLSSALTAHLLRAPVAPYSTSLTVVVDPGADTPGGDLPKSQRAAARMPSTATVHGGRWRNDGAPVTPARMRQLLQDTPPGSTFMFIGHGRSPDDGRSTAEAGIVLAADLPGAPTGILTAAALLSPPQPDAVYQFPARVVLAACNTASADKDEAGDWLSLVPAVHWSGAAEVVSSVVPVLDGHLKLEIGLADLLTGPTGTVGSLADHLIRLQRAALGMWRDGERMPPLDWAFYLASGVTPEADRSAAPSTDYEPIWTREAVSLFQEAANFAVAFRRRVLHPSAVVAMVIADELFDAESLVGSFVWYPILGWELVHPARHPLPHGRKQAARPSRACRRIVEAAEARARVAGRRHVLAADVLLAIGERRRTPGSWLVRRATRIRHASVQTRMLTVTPARMVTPAANDLLKLDPPVALTLEALGFTADRLRRNAAEAERLVRP